MAVADASLLSRVPIFDELDDAERAALERSLKLERVPSGQILVNYGDPARAMYFVRSGTAEAYVENDTGERVVLEKVKPGGILGEIALLANSARTASVQATSDMEVLRLNREDLEEFILNNPAAALHLMSVMARRLQVTGEKLRHTATRNVNEVLLDTRTPVQKAADWIAQFSGSIPFLLLHAALFSFWIIWNLIPGLPHFDPFPYGLLTMSVSLEAIFLSTFMLLSQNRQAEKDRVRSDVEYDVNLKAEMEIGQLHVKVDRMRSELLALLASRPDGRR